MQHLGEIAAHRDLDVAKHPLGAQNLTEVVGQTAGKTLAVITPVADEDSCHDRPLLPIQSILLVPEGTILTRARQPCPNPNGH